MVFLEFMKYVNFSRSFNKDPEIVEHFFPGSEEMTELFNTETIDDKHTCF